MTENDDLVKRLRGAISPLKLAADLFHAAGRVTVQPQQVQAVQSPSSWGAAA